MSLWTDDRERRTYIPPDEPPRQGAEPPVKPPFNAPPGASEPRRGRPWLAAVGGGAVSAVVVSAVLLGTGVAGGDKTTVIRDGSSNPVTISASDAKGDLVRTIYAAASPSVASVRTSEGSGT